MIDPKTMRSRFDKSVASLGEKVLAFPWHRRDAYACWLAQSYYFVEHTSTLLTLMASKFGPQHPKQFNAALAHLREEIGHEELLRRDLKAVDAKVEDFPELLEAAMMYQSQYYWVERCGPLSLTGFSLLLEGLATTSGQKVFDIVTKAHGKNAGSFLRLHTQADAGHYEMGLANLASANQKDLEHISRSLTQCNALYQGMLESILKHLGQVVPMKKAA